MCHVWIRVCEFEKPGTVKKGKGGKEKKAAMDTLVLGPPVDRVGPPSSPVTELFHSLGGLHAQSSTSD